MQAPHLIPSVETQDAFTLLHAGQVRQAAESLMRLLVRDPRNADAHWLLASVHFSRGQLDAASRELGAALAVAPRHARSHALLGEVLVAAGRGRDAERAFRAAIAAGVPDAGNVASRGDAFVPGVTDDGLPPRRATPDVLLAQGRAALDSGRAADAATLFARALALAPGSIGAEIYLATALADSGQAADAERVIRTGLAAGRVLPESHFVLGRALMAGLRPDAAVAALRRAIDLRPDYVAAHVSLCELLWMHTGDVAAACATLDATLRARPDLGVLRVTKAKLLEAARSPAAAVAELDAALARGRPDFELCLAAAQAAVKCDAPRALEYARQALALRPNEPTALAAYCAGLLGAGRAQDAEALATRMLAATPDDGQVIALRATAWRLLGDARYRALYDYRRVLPSPIDVPDGWTSRTDYLADLAAALRRLHVYRAPPVHQSLRTGSQVDLAFAGCADPALRAFPQAIDGPIRRYMERLRADDDPFARRGTGRYRLHGAWSVALRPHGYHVNHVHPEGWLSSACYIALPPGLDDASHAGWIGFGQPPIPTVPPLAAEHFVRPEPGLLVLFPSWMWHGTVPFDGSPGDTRLSIAFDVIPA